VKGSAYTVGCAAAIALVASVVLTAAGRVTEPYRVANAKAEKVRTVMSVLGVPFDSAASAEELLATFAKNVREEQKGGIAYYVYSPADSPGEVKSVAFRFQGAGLWGPIEGFLALEPDFRTIRGLAFYRQEETPGLGGEISSQSFRDQFRGKKIVQPDGKPGIAIVKPGMAKGPNEVDGISGATMTGEKVEQIINQTIDAIIKEVGSD